MNFWVSIVASLSLVLSGCSSNISPAQQAVQNASGQTPASQAVKSAADSQGDLHSDISEPKSNLNVYFLDVGQADSILLTDSGSSMLIDAGNNADGDDVVEFIKSKGITSLDYVVGTHPHEDHIGGMDDVINSFPVDMVLMPDIVTTTKAFSDVLDSIERNQVSLAVPEQGDTYQLGSTLLTTISNLKTSDKNNSSIVLRADHGETSILFTGDAEAEAEQSILSSGVDIKCDILKAGHHGSNTSTSSAFLKAIHPEVVIISCGIDNSYGHPSPETLDKLIGLQVWRTDLNGTVTISSNGERYSVSVEKEES